MTEIHRHPGERDTVEQVAWTAREGDPALSELARADRERYRAMLDGDLAALDRLLHEGLSYTHSSALQEGKTEYLESLRSGRVRYLDAHVQEAVCQPHGEIALMQGKVQLRAIIDGVERVLDNRFLSVWKHDRSLWRLLAWASTPVPRHP